MASKRRKTPKTANKPGPVAAGAIIKRYRKRDRQHTYGLRIRAYGERFWVPLGTEREGWNDVRAADKRDEIMALVRRGAWRPPDQFVLDPRDKDPGFHEFASDWLARYRRTVGERTGELAEDLLGHHVLPYLREYTLKEIDYALLSCYVAHKLDRNDEIDQAAKVGVILRDARGRPRRKLKPRTINMSLDVLSKVLKDANKRGLIPGNPAADSELRLRVNHRRGNFLEADELLAVIDAGGSIDERVSPKTLARGEMARRLRAQGKQWKDIGAEIGVAPTTAIWLADRQRGERRASVRRAILATLGCAGLRNSEVCDLNVVDLDFAHGVINVRDAKTEAGIRKVNMTPWVRDELLAYHATRPDAQPDHPAFPTRTGGRRDRNNINRRVIAPAVTAANAALAQRKGQPLPDDITAHTFRRTFITLMLEAGAPVPYVQHQVGHEDATTTLNIYAQVLRRRDRQRHGQAFDALMADAVPSDASIIISGAHLRDPEAIDMPMVPSGSGHGNDDQHNL